jgi:UDP-2,3-diacylglucosamine pyrophosphatase LpxH
VLDALVISDLHLGSDNCQAKQLVHFLAAVRGGELTTRRLVLNGDVFDSIDFRRLRKQHWRVLSQIRKLSDETEIVWVHGNHDGDSECVSHLLGVNVVPEYEFESGGRRFLMLHGHRFDEFLERYPLTSRFADVVYRFLQWVDKSHTVARTAKHNSKTFLRCAEKVRDLSVAYAREKGCDAVCCGHTHLPAAQTTGPVHYFNSGCWTERPCHYLAVAAGAVELRTFAEEVPEPVDQALVPVVS